MKVVVLLSGGMDSSVLLHHVSQEHEVVMALGFHYGSKHNEQELECARWQAKAAGVPFKQIDLPFINKHFSSDLLESGGDIPDGHYEEQSMKRTVVPFRNGIMLSIAAGFAESQDGEALAIAAHAGDHAIYPDCRTDFMKAMASSIRLGTYAQLEILAPFVQLRKEEIAARGGELEVDFSHTWSCYKGGGLHCGTCGTCTERKEAFELAKLPDVTVYASGSKVGEPK